MSHIISLNVSAAEPSKFNKPSFINHISEQVTKMFICSEASKQNSVCQTTHGKIKNLLSDEKIIRLDIPEIPEKAHKEYSIYLKWDNDNAVWEVIAAGKDDVGFTHGLEFGIVDENFMKRHMKAALSYSTKLYTRPLRFNVDSIQYGRYEDGLMHIPQVFAEENLIKFIIETPRARLYIFDAYARTGLGLIEVNTKDSSNIFHASKQQKSFHSFLNNFNPGFAPVWEDIESPLAIQMPDGSIEYRDQIRDRFVMYYVGLEKDLRNKSGRTHLKLQTETGKFSTDMYAASYKEQNAQMILGHYTNTGRELYLSVRRQNEIRSQSKYSDGKRSIQSFQVGINGHRWDFSSTYSQTTGAALEHVPNDIGAFEGESKKFEPIYTFTLSRKW